MALAPVTPKPCVPYPTPLYLPKSFLNPQCSSPSSEKPSWIFHIQTEWLPLSTVLGPLHQLLCTCLIHTGLRESNIALPRLSQSLLHVLAPTDVMDTQGE